MSYQPNNTALASIDYVNYEVSLRQPIDPALTSQAGVKRYVALLTQTGTAAPVANVLENSFGAPIVWTRASPGIYSATLAGAFTVGKTFSPLSELNPTLFVTNSLNLDFIGLITGAIDGFTLQDAVLSSYPFSVVVYPS